MRRQAMTIALAVAAVSCGESEPVSTAGYQYSLSEDGVTFDSDAQLAAARSDGATDAQMELIEDGLISFEEYEQAILTMISCSTERGGEVLNRGVQSTFGYPRVEVAILDDPESLGAYDACWAEESKRVETIWYAGHDENEESLEDESARYKQWLECVRENGDVAFDIEAAIRGEAELQPIADEANRLVEDGVVDCFELTGF